MSAAKRLDVYESHLTTPNPKWVRLEKAEQFIDRFYKKMRPDEEFAKRLCGPVRSGVDQKAALHEIAKAQIRGCEHELWVEYQRKYGDRGMATNLVIPSFTLDHANEGAGATQRLKLIMVNQVLISDPEDAQRIAVKHVRKQPNFTGMFGPSVISTTDNEHWKKQRRELTPVFMPTSSLQHIFPVSVKRAEQCTHRLRELSRSGTEAVDMNEFLLHEAKAQLQMALFGRSEEEMEKLNRPFRAAMGGLAHPANARVMAKDMIDSAKSSANSCPMRGSQCPVTGPLGAALGKGTQDFATQMGNALIFGFAGHDTTGHTMTWLLFELSRNPEIQKRVQKEVDDLFAQIGDRPLQYKDLTKLKFMTRCIMETLRLWPAVPNGTFRQLESDEYIKGPGGEPVLLPEGTFCQILNWTRHRNPDLWGPDADKFNPDREFLPHELWDGKGFSAANPATYRFSPFTFAPRDCLGKNFAQMEMRAIMCYLLREFTFEETPVTKGKAMSGVNYGTLGPKDLRHPDLQPRHPIMAFGGARLANGMVLRPVLRSPH